MSRRDYPTFFLKHPGPEITHGENTPWLPPAYRAFIGPWQTNSFSTDCVQPRVNRCGQRPTRPPSNSVGMKTWLKPFKSALFIPRGPPGFVGSASSRFTGRDTTRNWFWVPGPKEFSPPGRESGRLDFQGVPEHSGSGAGGPLSVALVAGPWSVCRRESHQPAADGDRGSSQIRPRPHRTVEPGNLGLQQGVLLTDVIKPTSKVYRMIVIKPVRTGIKNFGRNLTSPLQALDQQCPLENGAALAHAISTGFCGEFHRRGGRLL